MEVLTINDLKVAGKRVLVRVDFNVPLNEETGVITDDSRIRAAIPTIQFLIKERAKLILCSHLGRPKGVDDKLRMNIVAKRFEMILCRKVTALKDCIGPEVEKNVLKMEDGDVVLLENLRFYPQEEKNDDSFARNLAKLADIYVDDAFGTAHRTHASVVGVTKYLPSVAGFLLKKEIDTLREILENPGRPFIGLFGGAKVSDKVAMLNNVMSKMDRLLIGGGMAGTFLKASEYEIGQSLVEKDMVGTAKELMRQAEKSGIKLVLPADVVVADIALSEAKTIITVPVDEIPKDLKIVDIGEKTIAAFKEALASGKTVFWNGPVGIYEQTEFARGTIEMARYLAGLSAKTIIGGGSTAEIVHELGLTDNMTFVSTGGGASLSFLSGEPLPGVKALLTRNNIPDKYRNILKS